jgi:hypothetical protein
VAGRGYQYPSKTTTNARTIEPKFARTPHKTNLFEWSQLQCTD